MPVARIPSLLQLHQPWPAPLWWTLFWRLALPAVYMGIMAPPRCPALSGDPPLVAPCPLLLPRAKLIVCFMIPVLPLSPRSFPSKFDFLEEAVILHELVAEKQTDRKRTLVKVSRSKFVRFENKKRFISLINEEKCIPAQHLLT